MAFILSSKSFVYITTLSRSFGNLRPFGNLSLAHRSFQAGSSINMTLIPGCCPSSASCSGFSTFAAGWSIVGHGAFSICFGASLIILSAVIPPAHAPPFFEHISFQKYLLSCHHLASQFPVQYSGGFFLS